MTQGHLYIVFGEGYEKAAVASVQYLRKVSALPVCILTNIPEQKRSSDWKSLDVQFKYYQVADLANREYKTNQIEYSPFDETLYTDCDSVILSKDFMQAFEMLKFCDIAVPMHNRDESAHRLATPIYQQAIGRFKPKGEVFVYQGGICCFKKNEKVRKFFKLFNEYWRVWRFRDMPALMCAIHNSKDLCVGLLPETMGFRHSTVIKHFYGWDLPVTLLPQFKKVLPDEKTLEWKERKAFTRV